MGRKRLPSVLICSVLAVVACRSVNHAPDPPVALTGPALGYIDSTYSFTTSASDPDADSVFIRFDWGNGDTSDWSLLAASGETVACAYSWPDSTTFQVSAQAMDIGGLRSVWSASHQVHVEDARLGTARWSYPTRGAVTLSPAIAPDGTVYFCSRDTIFALEPDGRLRWCRDYGFSFASSPSVGPDSTIYTGNWRRLIALAPSGHYKWHYDTNGDVRSSPAIGADGTVYFGSDDSCVYALAPDGTLRWKYRTWGAVGSSPALGPDRVLYIGSGFYLYALSPDGTLAWYYPTSGPVSSSPAIGADGTVYFGSDDGRLYALTAEGFLKWWYQTGGPVRSSAAVGSDGTVYISAGDGYVYALRPDGTEKWRVDVNGGEPSVTIARDGTVYIVEHGILALNPNGTLRWLCYVSALCSSPVVGPDGTVYIGTERGYLCAIHGSAPLADSPWPKFQHDNQNTGRAGGS